jgi:two-component system chemotaxis response regulator CheY
MKAKKKARFKINVSKKGGIHMKILIVEDDFTCRTILQRLLSPYGTCDIAVDGSEAVNAFKTALEENEPYNLICLDIMMPIMDGRKALKEIRRIEDEIGINVSDRTKIIMTTALGDAKSILGSFTDQCEAYLVKPVSKDILEEKLLEFGLI